MNMLLPVTLVIFIGIIVINIAQILKNGLKNWLSDLKSYINLTVGLNWLSSLCFFAIFALQKPVFYYWDEYSFWGKVCKDHRSPLHHWSNPIKFFKAAALWPHHIKLSFSVFFKRLYRISLAFGLCFFLFRCLCSSGPVGCGKTK